MKSKTLLSLLTAGAISLLFLSSCQQDPDIDLNPPPSAEDSAYVKMVVTLDTTAVPGLDTVYKHTYTYDAQKRLALVNILHYDNGVVYDRSQMTRHYNGTDTLPYMSVNLYGDPSDGEIDSVYHFYENGIVVRDSAVGFYDIGVGPRHQNVTRFTNLGNGKYVIKRVMKTFGLPTVDSDSIRSSRVTQNGNDVTLIDTVWSSTGLVQVYKYLITYDNNPNPAYRLALPYPLFNDLDGISGDSFFVLGEKTVNNPRVIDETITFPPNPPISSNVSTINYEYRADGYPIRFMNPGMATDGVSHYIYTKL